MSRRLPPSAASRLVDALVARYPRAGWDGLPPVPSSDDGAVLDADALAMRAELAGRYGRGRVPNGAEFARLAVGGGLPTPYDVTMCARWRSCRQVYRFDATLAAELGGQGDGGAVPAEALRMLPYPIVYVEAPALEAPWRAVAFALGKVDEVAQQRGTYPGHVALPYWASQRAYDAGHVPADGGDWRMANANSRLVAFALHERGIPVEWADGATVPPEAAHLG